MFSSIDHKKSLLDQQRPLPKYTLRSLQEKILLEWTYHSNAIEGNTLTLNETKVVLEGITVGGKTIREHLEAINHQHAISYLEDWIEQGSELSEWQIRNLHRLVLKGIDDEYAGVYRNQQVFISGAEHVPPPAFQVEEEMKQLIAWYNSEATELHPVERAAILHAKFVGVHPFVDGNGRTSRLLMNFELMKNGYPPVVIKVENRLAYYEALDASHTTNDYSRFTELVAKEAESSLDLYLSVSDFKK